MRFSALFIMLLTATVFCHPAKAAGQDLSKSIIIGNGPKTVIEFTDPDCPFCRKASKYFDGRSDVTRHVFFYPLSIHPLAKEKVQYILSQMDKVSAYHNVMSGKLDSVQRFEGITQRGIRLQEEHLEIAKKYDINSTPIFMISGRKIEGFDLKRIEDALGPRF